jgi:hypothetical protein
MPRPDRIFCTLFTKYHQEMPLPGLAPVWIDPTTSSFSGGYIVRWYFSRDPMMYLTLSKDMGRRRRQLLRVSHQTCTPLKHGRQHLC